MFYLLFHDFLQHFVEEFPIYLYIDIFDEQFECIIFEICMISGMYYILNIKIEVDFSLFKLLIH